MNEVTRLLSVAERGDPQAAASQQITLSGWLKGTGSFNNLRFTGTFDPGASPTIAIVGNIAFDTGAALNIDIGGTRPGSQYGQIISSGTPTLAGTVNPP